MKSVDIIYRTITMVIACVMLQTAAIAQTPYQEGNTTQTASPNKNGNNKGKIEAMRVAFITHRLDLTPAESERFWPIYNSYRHDLAQIRHSYYPHDDGSDPHIDADAQLQFEQQKLDLKKRYQPIYEQAIGKAKVNLLVGAEDDFKKMLIQIMRNRRQQRPNWR